MHCGMPGFPVPHHLLEFTQIHVHWIDDAIQPSHLSFFCLQSFLTAGSFPVSQLGLYHVVKALELQHQSFQRIFRTDFLRIDRFDLAVQGILKIPFQPNSSKASILQHSAFFMVQLSHLYMTTGKTIALTRWTFVSRVMALLSNTLCLWGVCVYINFAICNNMGGLGGHYTMWNKTQKDKHYMTSLKCRILKSTKQWI